MPISVNAEFLAEAKKPGKFPITLMQIESNAALEEVLTSKADWDASVVSTNIDTASVPGSAKVDVVGVVPLGNLTEDILHMDAFPETTKLSSVLARFYWLDFYGTDVNAGIVIRTTGGTIVLTIPKVAITAQGNFASGIYYADVLFQLDAASTATLTAGTDYEVVATNDYPSGGAYVAVGIVNTTTPDVTTVSYYKNSATLRTKTMDLGLVPAAASKFYVTDTVPANTTLTYEAFADNVDPPTTSRGAVVDGDDIGAAGYRYVRIEASYTSDGVNGATLDELSVSGGDTQFDYLSNVPSAGATNAKPILNDRGAGQLSNKISRDKLTTISEISPSASWTEYMGDLLATGYLKNKAVAVSVGFPSLSRGSYVPLFTGTWYDYSANQTIQEISIKLRDVLKPFAKVKLPAETIDGSGNINTTPIVWTAANAIQIILDIFDAMGISDRFIARTEWEALRDGAYSGSQYNLTRTLSKPKEALKLLGELSVLTRIFMVPYSDGKLYPAPFDATATPTATLDARFMDFTAIDGGQKDLYTRQLLYYNAIVSDPGDEEADYSKLILSINASAEIDWDTYGEKRLFDKWGASSTLLTAVATQWDTWFANPAMMHKVQNVPLHFLETQPGDLVYVENVRRPVASASYPGLSVNQKCLVMGRSVDILKGSLTFDLLEV